LIPLANSNRNCITKNCKSKFNSEAISLKASSIDWNSVQAKFSKKVSFRKSKNSLVNIMSDFFWLISKRNLDKIKAIDVNYQQFTAVAIYSRRKK